MATTTTKGIVGDILQVTMSFCTVPTVNHFRIPANRDGVHQDG